MSVNTVAFCTSTALAAATAGAVFMAATTASTVAVVAYAILAVCSGGASLASISAWMVTDSSAKWDEYFGNVVNHAGCAIAGMIQVVSQVLLQSLIQGVASGISRNIERRIAG